METEISLPSSLSPSRNKAKVQPRYLGPHISSRHDSCKHGKHFEVEPEANSLNLKKPIKTTKKLSQHAVRNQISHLNNTKFPDHTEIHKSENDQGKHVDSETEYPKAKIAQENTNSSVKNIVLQLSKPTAVKEVTPHVIAEGKASIASKTKARLIRSSSKNKSSRNLSIRIKHETDLKESTETSEVSEAESENGQENTAKSNSTERVKNIKRTTSSANRIVLSLQMKKLRSIRRTTTHKYDLSYPLKRVNGASEKEPPLESSSSPRLTHIELPGSDSSLEVTEPVDISESSSVPRLSKVKSRKKSSSTHVELKSSKQNEEPLGSDSSLEVTKLKSISENESDKKKSSQHKSISNMVSKKFMSIMRSSSVRNKNKAVKIEIIEEESSCEVDGVCNVKQTLPRSSSTHTEGNATGPSKLKFRTGSVINRSSSVNGARRLWFNLGKAANSEKVSEKVTVANSNGLTRKRSLRRKSSVRSRNFELQAVVLKHQKTMKKDEESLFNEVIEKTASRLIGSKKSKVRALVGAFENVISLLESKPASSVA